MGKKKLKTPKMELVSSRCGPKIRFFTRTSTVKGVRWFWRLTSSNGRRIAESEHSYQSAYQAKRGFLAVMETFVYNLSYMTDKDIEDRMKTNEWTF